VTVHNLFALAHYCPDRYQDYRDKAERIFKSNEAMLKQAPFVFTTAVAGGDDAVRGMEEVRFCDTQADCLVSLPNHTPMQYLITGKTGSRFVVSMLQAIHGTRYIPNKVVIQIDPENPPSELARYNSVVEGVLEGLERDKADGKEVKESLRICRDFACGLPITDLEQARKEVLG